MSRAEVVAGRAAGACLLSGLLATGAVIWTACWILERCDELREAKRIAKGWLG